MKKQINFLNLSNGTEAITEIEAPFSFIRIQSTTLERKDYIKLFLDLDHNFLLHLALGYHCIVHDRGTNRKNSKVISRGIPIIEYVLNRYWYGIEEKCWFKQRNGVSFLDETGYASSIYDNLFVYDSNSEKQKVKTKLKYYKKFLNSDRVHLQGESVSTKNDGNYPYFFELLKTNYNANINIE